VLASLATADTQDPGSQAVAEEEKEDRDLLRVLSLAAPLLDLPLQMSLFVPTTSQTS